MKPLKVPFKIYHTDDSQSNPTSLEERQAITILTAACSYLKDKKEKETTTSMRDNKVIHPVLFLDDWPLPPNNNSPNGCQGDVEDYIGPGMNNMRKWRIQTLLAVNPWGIPVMAFKEAYERMFRGKIFEPKDHGYENIGAMVYDLPDIFAVQEPDDVTALMFPDYPHDRILHDARLGHEFACAAVAAAARVDDDDDDCTATNNATRVDGQPLGGIVDSNGNGADNNNKLAESVIDGYRQIATGWSSSTIGADICGGHGRGGIESSTNNVTTTTTTVTSGDHSERGGNSKTIDPDILISYAWIHRDTDFPPDVVLAGEQYNELILPMTSAHIPGTRGVHQAIIVGVANPSSFYINVKHADTVRFQNLTNEILQFFMQLGPAIDSYNVPEEFIYPGFPCLVYSRESKCWERCVIVSRSKRTNRVLVEYVDFGGCITVNRIYLYLMPRRFFDLPKQAILCSLIGVRPKKDQDDKWSPNISCRMRFFSQPRYWLDVLLVEPKVIEGTATTSKSAAAIGDKSTETTATTAELAMSSALTSAYTTTIETQTSGEQFGELQTPPVEGKPKRKKRILKKRLDFEAIICDRHDNHGNLDIFLNHILVLETYGSFDFARADEYNSLMASFKEALATLPRPVSPFIFEGDQFWPEGSIVPGLGNKIQAVEVKVEEDDDDDD